MSDTPRVSFILITYNQEQYVRQAVRSALAQSYEPLEIILSDDCSPDRTFEIMQEEVRAYRGSHQVRALRSSHNVGLAENLNRACNESTGDIIVLQAGDDVSVAERTAALVTALESPSPADLVVSDVLLIDEQSNVLQTGRGIPQSCRLSLEDAIARHECWVCGAAVAFKRELFIKYGPLNPDVIQEDNVIPFWAMLGRGIREVEGHFVFYRKTSATVSAQMHALRTRAAVDRWVRNRRAITQHWIDAWDRSGRRPSWLRQELVRWERAWDLDSRAFTCSRMGAACLAAGGLVQGLPWKRMAAIVKRHVIRAV